MWRAGLDRRISHDESNVVEAPIDDQNCSPPVRASTLFHRMVEAVRGVALGDSAVTMYRISTDYRRLRKPHLALQYDSLQNLSIRGLFESHPPLACTLFDRLFSPTCMDLLLVFVLAAPSIPLRSRVVQYGLDEHGYKVYCNAQCYFNMRASSR